MIYRANLFIFISILILCELAFSHSINKGHKRRKDIRAGAEDESKQSVHEEYSVTDNSNEASHVNDKDEQIKDMSEPKQGSESNQELTDVSENNGADISEKNIETSKENHDGELKQDTVHSNIENNGSDESDNEKISQINENNTPINDNDENEAQSRPYAVGDIFTPQELLPITQKLLSKLENPGEGKGFVSSSKNPEQLADKLFEAFFMTFKRIVTLSEIDINGLDALQALALSGEAIENSTEEVTEPGQMVFLRGQMVKMNSFPKKTKYKLIMKSLEPNENKLQTEKRRGIQLAKKLRKKRRLVVHKRRLGQDVKEKKSACHWRYECTIPSDLDTCRLHTECVNHTTFTKKEHIDVPHKSDEHTKGIKQFRKMLGISLIDEEVEKILENRVIRLKPPNFEGGSRIERVESLSEYFNNIAMVQANMTTKISEDIKENNNEIEKAVPVENQETVDEIRKSLKVSIKNTTPYKK